MVRWELAEVKSMGQQGFWDVEARQAKLAAKQNILERLNAVIPWENFRPILEQLYQKPRKSQAGRKPTDVILMLKLLVLQKLYNISDESLEYQVNDRLSFMTFLGLGLEDVVPDATTVWLFRKQLRDAELIDVMFEQFEQYLCQQGYQAQGGQIIDATLIPVPKRQDSEDDKQQLNAGETPQSWQENPHRAVQKDRDACWTKKGNVSHFGYKDHISIDVEHGFIRRYAVTDASVHDSQAFTAVLDADNQDDGVWADSAYRAAGIETLLETLHFESHIHERAYRNRPLSETQKQANRDRSQTRAKVEHVFGRWVMQMGGKLLRSIGLANANAHLGLKNLTYNLLRYSFWQTQASV
uniref:Transposase IS4 family protein n=1 Tax=Cyanothece sp. (strain PCC 7425 / ATCC 29141) TaxID=395961 RepID=B8HYT3_CYAP4